MGVALGLLRAGLEGALLNVRVNLEQLTDVGNKDRIGAEADRLQREAIGLIESAGNILK